MDHSSPEAPLTHVTPMRWVGTPQRGHLRMLDQRRLPLEEVYHDLERADQVASAIRDMVVRGAPAIGIAAAFGVYLGVRELRAQGDDEALRLALPALFAALADTRPTAVNLFWALDRMRALLETASFDGEAGARGMQRLFEAAEQIMREDRENNVRLGEHGAKLLPEGARVLTHCNTGGLATGGYGTALGVIRAAHAAGRLERVLVDETRPYLQGARLTAWECVKDGIPATLITDSMAAHFMQRGEVDAVIVGADRIAADGGTANKIGTYALAVLARHHGLPFYVAAPCSTLDLQIERGEQIPIEERSAREVTHLGERALAPPGIDVAHPAFDVTPGELVTAIITERGVARAPYHQVS